MHSNKHTSHEWWCCAAPQWLVIPSSDVDSNPGCWHLGVRLAGEIIYIFGWYKFYAKMSPFGVSRSGVHMSQLVIAGFLLASVVSVALALTTPDYKSALDKSILFFDLQRSGRLPNWQRLNWRQNSGLTDGRMQNVRRLIYSFVRLNKLISSLLCCCSSPYMHLIKD